MSSPAINCKFGEAQVGDLLPMQSPLHNADETVARLVEVKQEGECVVHIYDLHTFGVWYCRAKATQTPKGTKWEVMT